MRALRHPADTNIHPLTPTMMTEEERTQHVLDAQEHPERYTDEELAAAYGDAEDLVRLKRACLMEEARQADADVEAAWQAFSKAHPARSAGSRRWQIAASLTGILMATTVALAAAIGLGWVGNPFGKTVPKTENAIRHDTRRATATAVSPADTTRLEPTHEAGTRIYDNVTLSALLREMADYYRVDITYRREETKHIRLYYEWNRQQTLDQNIELLNSFQKINISRTGNQLTVE